jgi:hypothetical protein
VENDSFLDPSENMLIKRVLSISSGFTSLKTFIDDNISVTGIDRALAGKLHKNIMNKLSGMRYELSQWYIFIVESSGYFTISKWYKLLMFGWMLLAPEVSNFYSIDTCNIQKIVQCTLSSSGTRRFNAANTKAWHWT